MDLKLQLHFPMQNWLKMESSRSSVAVFPTISPTALTAIRSSLAASSRCFGSQCLHCPLRRHPRPRQRLLVPRINHHFKHPRLEFPRPGQCLDGVLQRLNPLPAPAANVCDWSAGLRPPCRVGDRSSDGNSSLLANPVYSPPKSVFSRQIRSEIFIRPRSATTGIEQMQDKFRPGQRFLAATDAFLFNRIVRLAQTRRIHKDHRNTPDIGRFLNGIARRARKQRLGEPPAGVPGTTRDTIEETANIRGLPWCLWTRRACARRAMRLNRRASVAATKRWPGPNYSARARRE